MIHLYQLTAWIPAVEPGSCSHIELRAPGYKKRFALQSEGGYWGTFVFHRPCKKGTNNGVECYYSNGFTLDVVMVSTNGKDGPTLPVGVYGSTETANAVGTYDEPESCKAIKRKKPVVDAHWNATFGTVANLGLAKEIQRKG